MITKNRWLKQISDKEEIFDIWKNQALKSDDILINKKNFFDNQKIKRDESFIPNYRLHFIEEDHMNVYFIFEENNYINAFLSFKSHNKYNFKLNGIAIDEEGLTATVELSGPQKLKLFAFANDYYANKNSYEDFVNKKELILSGWALRLNQQLNPPEIKKPDGKKITTSGSTILLPQQSSQLDEYAYQFQVQEATEFNFLDYTNIIKIKTRLALMPNGEIPLELYAPENVITPNYYPEKNHDIMGEFILSCAIY